MNADTLITLLEKIKFHGKLLQGGEQSPNQEEVSDIIVALKQERATKPVEPVVHVDNNRFMTALEVCQEWRLDDEREHGISFQAWCQQRLNALKAEHFTKR